jgi:hypothetical protein
MQVKKNKKTNLRRYGVDQEQQSHVKNKEMKLI